MFVVLLLMAVATYVLVLCGGIPVQVSHAYLLGAALGPLAAWYPWQFGPFLALTLLATAVGAAVGWFTTDKQRVAAYLGGGSAFVVSFVAYGLAWLPSPTGVIVSFVIEMIVLVVALGLLVRKA